ncbi:E3 ubiquitin/ISG15 ligase TRIM25-like isoform X2 [Hemiscyllium ocellatum]|uniref:E3 ubiquitin/ISG15 ligase TRIM25-like isoform X2 n=1 Tax=Hemiscyllium ocellatum TaxID=170820 RepID=UPI002966A99F|nr:E3 ubiquitin/ISG15 ligase TRIM25-like isoform X2 [Hemiscyllium ocellatum]
MEATAVEEELNCAVCHQMHQDPVSLLCQHSFCRKCLEDIWAQEVSQDGFSCPQCHQTFNPKPTLKRSTPTVPCDHCIDSESPAVKTCLKCETSFCSFHLKTHMMKENFKDHKLVNPVTDLMLRKCPDHQKNLEFFCIDDGVCVCASCGVIGRHRSHKMVGLDETEATKKKEMKNEVEKLQTVLQNCISKQKNLEKSEAEIKTHASELKGKLSKMFSEKRKQLNEDEKCALRLIDEHEHSLLSEISNNLATLHLIIEQMRLLNEKAQNLMQEDSISFIQKSAELLPKVVETQKLTFPDPPEPVLNLSNLSQFLKEWMEESEKSYSTREKLRQMHECMESTCGEAPAEPARVAHTQITDEKILREAIPKSSVRPRLAEATPIVIKLQSKVLNGFPRESKGELSQLTLDPTTASKNLILSVDLRSVVYSEEEQPHASNPSRFKTYSQILCKQSFYCGYHSWDVEMDGNWWGIGITYGTIPKTGSNSDLRKTSKAWCLYQSISMLKAYHNHKHTPVPLKSSIKKIRVFLDYDAGTVSFFQVTDTLIRLHMFKTTFTEPVYPAFCCENNTRLRLSN